MPQIVYSPLKSNKIDKAVGALAYSFLGKLAQDDTAPGLHIEPISKALDPRVRTGRVDLHWRAVLFKLTSETGEPVYVYMGTWNHDEAIQIASSKVLRTNPVNGVAELIDADLPPVTRATAPAFQKDANDVSFLRSRSYFETDLTEEFGFEPAMAKRAFAAQSEDDLLALIERVPTPWQQNVLLAMGVGDSISQIKETLGLTETPETAETEDERLVNALKHPAAQMQFTFIDDDDELRRVIEDQDFGAWRVFLHPEQRAYATRSYNGAFRLSGGAGTGKTVILLHRARDLWRRDPSARIVLTTYTKALAANLQRDLERLDPEITIASELGEPGVLIRGIDALASAVRSRADSEFGRSAESVLGSSATTYARPVGDGDGWDEAVHAVGAELPTALQSKDFLEGEYLQVILPAGLRNRDEYLAIRRPGRRVPLDRAKRVAVWEIVERYREAARSLGRLSFAEIAAVGADWLGSVSGGLADHVLVDEGQDLTPLHWRLVRAIVPLGPDDLFIAEDTHQRIYGHHVVFSRYGIQLRGRSRRLTLNYRTTEQNLHYALGLLEGATYLDSDNEEEGVAGYRSSRRGPAPSVRGALNPAEQLDLVAEQLKAWESSGVPAGAVAVLTRTSPKKLQWELAQRGVQVSLEVARAGATKHPLAATMNSSKGLEFACVLLYDVSDGAIPAPWILKDQAAEEVQDVRLRERSLLYVAASRARDELVVTWSGKPSDLLKPAS